MIATSPTLFFEDLTVGQRASLTRSVLDDHLRALAEGSEAGLPVDGVGSFAAQNLFGQRIAHSLFTTSLISTVMGTKLPGPGAVYLSQSVQFLAPVRLGDLVTAQVEVVELVPTRRRARLYCECVCNGKPVLEGEAWIAVESRVASYA
jgi:3-hydroxybutyryl-CoA dehydratase